MGIVSACLILISKHLFHLYGGYMPVISVPKRQGDRKITYLRTAWTTGQDLVQNNNIPIYGIYVSNISCFQHLPENFTRDSEAPDSSSFSIYPLHSLLTRFLHARHYPLPHKTPHAHNITDCLLNSVSKTTIFLPLFVLSSLASFG